MFLLPPSSGPDDGGSKDLWDVGKLLPDYMALQPRRQPAIFMFAAVLWKVCDSDHVLYNTHVILNLVLHHSISCCEASYI
jgi:hypothetical protein